MMESQKMSSQQEVSSFPTGRMKAQRQALKTLSHKQEKLVKKDKGTQWIREDTMDLPVAASLSGEDRNGLTLELMMSALLGSWS